MRGKGDEGPGGRTGFPAGGTPRAVPPPLVPGDTVVVPLADGRVRAFAAPG